MIELKINSYADREKLIVALVNSGYIVKVEKRERQDTDEFYPTNDFYVVIDDVVHKNNGNETKINIPTFDEREYARNRKCPIEGKPCFCTGACMGMDNTNLLPYVEHTKYISK